MTNKQNTAFEVARFRSYGCSAETLRIATELTRHSSVVAQLAENTPFSRSEDGERRAANYMTATLELMLANIEDLTTLAEAARQTLGGAIDKLRAAFETKEEGRL